MLYSKTMRYRRLFRFLIFFSGIVSCLILLDYLSPVTLHHFLTEETEIVLPGLLHKSAKCKIPDFDPFDKSIIRFIEIKGRVDCERKPSITYEDGVMLKINRSVINRFYKDNFTYCKYQPIFRGPKENDDDYWYGPLEEAFSTDIKMKHEAVRVHCYNELDEIIYTNFHALIIPKPKVEAQCDAKFRQHLKEHQPKETLSVLLIGMDSMSHMNVLRQMPKTRRYLINDLGGFAMRGYTKVGDNTFLNMVPFTSGKYFEELNFKSSMTFDRFNFIWNDYSRNGYITLMGEDSTGGATFNFYKKGFSKAPTDYYYRPFCLAMTNQTSVWTERWGCVGDRYQGFILRKYVQDFVVQNVNKPNFVFSFHTILTHNYINNAGWADEPMLDFLRVLKDKGVFENTVLVLFGDHGFRYGGIRNTFIGKAEGRLPMIFLVFPPWFLKKYPDIARNLELNTKRLSTHFDTYETLKDILYFNGQVSKNESFGRGISFLREIPESRTCKDATIIPHWCMCFSWQKLSNSSNATLQAANALLSNINKQLDGHKDKCAKLKLWHILDASILIPDDVVVPFNKSLNDVVANRVDHDGHKTDVLILYQLVIQSQPGGGTFEGTISYNMKTREYSVGEDISRTNLYGNQSSCIKDFHLRKFCFCIKKT